MDKETLIEQTKGTRFKAGNNASDGADRRFQSMILSKSFRERCREFLLNEASGVEVGTLPGGFAILKDIAIGYKGVKPADRLAAITLMAKVCGELTETVKFERVNPFQSMTRDELLAHAEQLALELKTEPLRVVNAERGEAKSGISGT